MGKGNFSFKGYGKHLLAIVIFVVLSMAFFYPMILENKTLVQYDIKSGTGWGMDARKYHQETGEYAHWSNQMFSGMPANYTYMPESANVFKSIGRVLTFGRAGVNTWGLLFLYMLGFYILLVALGSSSWLAILGAIAYAFASYNLVIIDAGHISKGLVMATMAPIVGGVILCYRGKYILGAFLTLLFVGLNVAWGHQQISYYLLLTLLILFIVYLIYAIKEKTLPQFGKATAVLMIAALLAITPSLGALLPTMDYAKESMRGGSVLKNDANGKKESSGLDIDYAYQWSYGTAETFTLLIPNFAGGSSTYKVGENSETYKALLPTGQAREYAKSMPMYWADNEYKTFTSGTVYAGAIICFLFVLGLIIVRRQEKWWILFATILSILLAWGRNFYGFNDFLFHYLPLYNKFRTPEMALIIANMTMVILAVLALKELIEKYKTNPKYYQKSIYIAAGVVGGICAFFWLFGGSLFDFTSNADKSMPEFLQTALVADRKAMLRGDSFRSLVFILLAAALLWFYIRKPFKESYLVIAICVLVFIDLWGVDRRFIGADKFVSKSYAQEFVPTQADNMILQDKDVSYRVYNLTTSTFNESNTSYFHKSIGGYSPAKLRRYQDLIDFYLGNSAEMNRLFQSVTQAQGNFSQIPADAFPVINMLNTKYLIMPTQQGGVPVLNTHALGNSWFVDSVMVVDTPDDEIRAIGTINTARVATFDKSQSAAQLTVSPALAADSTAKISLTEYNNPGYLIYQSHSQEPRLAVFSEIFYKTWKAYIDGQEAPILPVNYTLRGLEIPAGDHKIEFKCQDEVILASSTYSLIGSIVVSVLLLGLLGLMFYKKRKESGAEAGR